MSLQFIFGNSGSGKSYYLYHYNCRRGGAVSGEKLSCGCAGAVYHADSERSVYGPSQGRDHE